MTIDWSSAGPDRILAHLHEVDRDSVEDVIANEAFNEDHVRLLLKDAGLDGEIVERLSREPRFFRRGLLRAELVQHPRLSRVRALELVPYLYWRDCLKVARNLRVHPQVRLVAEQHVAERIPDLTLGERVAIARSATRTVLHALRNDTDARVITAVLQNYRCTEEDVVLMVSRQGAAPQVLSQVARHPKWSVRPSVRGALVRNRRLPLPVGLGLLERLGLGELTLVSRQRDLPRLLRDSAKRLLEEQRRESRGARARNR